MDTKELAAKIVEILDSKKGIDIEPPPARVIV